MFTGGIGDYVKLVNETVYNLVVATKTDDVSFFKSIISTRQCGSGSDQYVNGWILNFMNSSDKQIMLKNVHDNRSKMEYKNIETNRTFELYTGIFSLTYKGPFAVPVYNAFRVETTSQSERKELDQPFGKRFCGTGGGVNDIVQVGIVSEPVTAKTTNLKAGWSQVDEILTGIDETVTKRLTELEEE